MAVQVAVTQPNGHGSVRTARGEEDIAPQYPVDPSMAKGIALSGYLMCMLLRHRFRRLHPVVLPLLMSLFTAPLLAVRWPASTSRTVGSQPPTPSRLDVGSFTLLVNGQRVGREQFSVQRVTSPDGGTLEARSESAIGDRRVAMRLARPCAIPSKSVAGPM